MGEDLRCLLLEEGLIEPALAEQMGSWKHSGFHVDRSVRIAAGDTDGLNRLAQYMARCPFSLARLLRITPEGQVIYKADKEHCREYPLPAEENLFGGVSRNFQVFEPLDFLAELTQHIPNQGEHLIRYFGCYSNMARGTKGAAVPGNADIPLGRDPSVATPTASPDRQARRRWAMLIQRVYQVDPLICPKCGGRMKIISFVEGRQNEVIRKILEHRGLWREPPPRGPPGPPVPPARTGGRAAWQRPAGSQASDCANGVEVDPDYLEHLRREAQGEQLDLPWEA